MELLSQDPGADEDVEQTGSIIWNCNKLMVFRAHREEPQILCSPFVSLHSLDVRQVVLFFIFFRKS